MTSTSRFKSLASPLLVLLALAPIGCGARVSLNENASATGGATSASTSTMTSLVTDTATSTGTFITPYTGTSTGVSTGVQTLSATSWVTSSRTVTYTGVATFTVSGTAVATSTMTAVSTNTNVCTNGIVPVSPGKLAVAAGYVTEGVLHGYGFTWKSDPSNVWTCISPNCNTTGCTPAFPTSSLCAIGVVAADTTYTSVVGLGFNLNQSSAGDTALSVAAPASISVVVSSQSYGSGLSWARVQLAGPNGNSYCVEAGSWTSGIPIPISAFNTHCWDPTSGTPLIPGTPVSSIHIVVPSDATTYRPFSLCLLDVTFM